MFLLKLIGRNGFKNLKNSYFSNVKSKLYNMVKLTTNYMGLELQSPIVAGASNMTENPEAAKKMEKAGAGAIVFKSLFEEQIQLEAYEHDESLTQDDERHAEMTDIFPRIEHAGPQDHLQKLKDIRKAVSIPLIASLNCVNHDTWIDYAKKLEETGIDALELNFYYTPTEFDKTAKEVEDEQIKVLKDVIKAVKIPVSVKLSSNYSNPLNYIKQLDDAGAKGVIIFNKLFQSDINIDSLQLQHPYYLTPEGEYKDTMRFVALLHGNVNTSIIANKSIYHGKEAVKMLLAGADAIQVVSALYKFQIDHIRTLNNKIHSWMSQKGFKSLDEFKGKMSRKKLSDPFAYRRSQYVDILLNSKQLFDKKFLP